MKFPFVILFCLSTTLLPAQKEVYGNLKLTYPTNSTYDTFMVKDSQGTVVVPYESITVQGKKTISYSLNIGSAINGSFSIYFGGSKDAVNDTLYFLSQGKNFSVEIKDSFALRNHIHFILKDVYSFEDIYDKYMQYINAQMQQYTSLLKQKPETAISRDQYTLQAGLDFVKNNLSNPYINDLFAIFIIHPPFFKVYFEQANDFYVQYLKEKIKDPGKQKLIEDKIESLKISLSEGNKAPIFSTRTIQDEFINNNTLKGKNAMIIFWATWCVPCMQELPDIKEIHEKYKDENLQMISVSLDTDSMQMVKVINKNNLDWAQVFNNKELIKAFQINPIPALFIIDENGIIIYNSIDRMKKYNLTDLQGLKAFLKKKFNH